MTDSSQASSATVRGQPMRKAILTDKAPPPLPFYSQAIVCNGMVYCSGNIGISPVTKQLIDGGIGDRTAQAINNLSAILEEAGSSLRNVVKVNIFLSDMVNFAAMNRVYERFFDDPKPVSMSFPRTTTEWNLLTGRFSVALALQSQSSQ
ncbi:MAG: hypothetical protein Q9190_007597 [Brigantiaea leucoxantha]